MHKLNRGFFEEPIFNLILAAENAKNFAYAPYSHYMVGAAVMAGNGEIYSGCNVENAAYTGTHAEAGAIANMVVSGQKIIYALACATKDGGACCGDCRQRIWEFSRNNIDLPIYLIDEFGLVDVMKIGELLPSAFILEV